MDKFNKILDEVKIIFEEARGSHDWDHTERVYKLCMNIGEKEKADLEILKYASILHDIGRNQENENNREIISHAAVGAQMAEKMLKKYELSKIQIDKILHCVETHSINTGRVPESLEAKILFDADKLDAIGAIGIGRAFVFAGEIGSKVHNKDIDLENSRDYSKDDTAYREFLIKLVNVKDKLFTKEGKRIAEGRHKFMVEFFNRINKEVEGQL